MLLKIICAFSLLLRGLIPSLGCCAMEEIIHSELKSNVSVLTYWRHISHEIMNKEYDFERKCKHGSIK